MDKVVVTQADRDAAEGLHAISEVRNSIIEKAFARHRIESQRPLLEAIRAIEEQLDDMDEWIGDEGDFGNQREAMRAAIKQAKGE